MRRLVHSYKKLAPSIRQSIVKQREGPKRIVAKLVPQVESIRGNELEAFSLAFSSVKDDSRTKSFFLSALCQKCSEPTIILSFISPMGVFGIVDKYIAINGDVLNISSMENSTIIVNGNVLGDFGDFSVKSSFQILNKKINGSVGFYAEYSYFEVHDVDGSLGNYSKNLEIDVFGTIKGDVGIDSENLKILNKGKIMGKIAKEVILS